MAQFKMNAEITLKANAAIKAIQAFEKGAKDSKKEFSILGRTIALDTKRIQKNLAGMALIAGAFFAGVISQSPHLRAEFKRLEASTFLLNVAIGEKLQPTVAFFVDTIIILQDKFLALPPVVQEVIIVTGFLTLALTAATIAAIGLWTALGPITAVIVGISFAIALLIVVWRDWDDIMKSARENTLQFSLIIAALTIPLGLVIIPILAIVAVLKNWRHIIETIGNSFIDLVVIIGLAMGHIGIFFIDLWAQGLTGLNTFLSAIWSGIQFIASGIGDMFNTIIGPIIDGFIWVINKAIDAYNAIPGVDNLSHVGRGGGGGGPSPTGTLAGGYTGVSAEERDLLRGAAEGADIQKDGLIFAHRDERISSKSEARASRRNARDGNGGPTIINYNTFKIGSVDSKKRIREMLREAERANKRSYDRRVKV